MSTWMLARQLTRLSPMENRRTPDDSFVMQHWQWSLVFFFFARGDGDGERTLKADRDPSVSIQSETPFGLLSVLSSAMAPAFNCPVSKPSRAFSSELHRCRWKGVEVNGQWGLYVFGLVSLLGFTESDTPSDGDDSIFLGASQSLAII
ncbi:unnamed protein product [Fusarium venenatum]|uniref:Uncharacterized protein n=1 Tax=Fusarium venenatum TaxID=56646 RepID=A0A2L2TVF8_9HYPO|nr:uncharacterized protein FVRRES_09864 [Fusarium venenatum]CEI69787.1 unnamed protein product [Fusarium venenatum]